MEWGCNLLVSGDLDESKINKNIEVYLMDFALFHHKKRQYNMKKALFFLKFTKFWENAEKRKNGDKISN